MNKIPKRMDLTIVYNKTKLLNTTRDWAKGRQVYIHSEYVTGGNKSNDGEQQDKSLKTSYLATKEVYNGKKIAHAKIRHYKDATNTSRKAWERTTTEGGEKYP